jgi:hypothetical protein
LQQSGHPAQTCRQLTTAQQRATATPTPTRNHQANNGKNRDMRHLGENFHCSGTIRSKLFFPNSLADRSQALQRFAL